MILVDSNILIAYLRTKQAKLLSVIEGARRGDVRCGAAPDA